MGASVFSASGTCECPGIVAGDAKFGAGTPREHDEERGHAMQEAWEGFEGGNWLNEIDVRDFIQKNYTPYEGDESFLVGPTERTVKLWDDVMSLLLKEREQGGVLDMDTKVVTGILSHKAGYVFKDIFIFRCVFLG